MYIKTISVVVLQLGWMCREGKSSGQYSPGYLYHCKLCGGSYHATDWEALKPVEPKGAQTTTMGGDSEEEKHTIDINYYPAGLFGLYCDGRAANMHEAMNLLSAAAERLNATTPDYQWSSGTQAAYERLGRALGVYPAAPPPLSIDDLKRFSLQELLAHLNNRTSKAERAAQCAWISEVQDAVRQLHERVCGGPPTATPAAAKTQLTVEQLVDGSTIRTLLDAVEVRSKRACCRSKFKPFDNTATKLRQLLDEYVEKDTPAAAPAEEPPKVKLAQRLAAFVEEKQSLEKAMREAHEAAFADVKWTKSAMRELFVAALADSRGYMIRVPTREVRGWNDGSAQRMFEDAGFAVDSYSGIRTMIDDVDHNGCSVFVIRF